MLEEIKCNDKILGIIIYHSFKKDGISFFTPDSFSQQLGYMNRPAGYKIPPHVHNIVERKVEYTQEVLYIKTGKVRIDFYDGKKEYLESRIVNAGDIVMLAHGGHGVEIIEQAELIEVKQGPYCGENDKVRFDAVDDSKIRINKHE